jgi:hypothetical protein
MSTTWSVVSQVGFWGWLLTAVGFILTVFPGRGLFRSVAALRWGAPMLLFYLLWVVGMINA